MHMRIPLRTWRLVLACLPMAAMLTLADEPSPPADDYSKGFEQFAKLGLPNLATAIYVKVEGCWTPHIEALLPYDWESAGNAWMISETSDAHGQPVKGTFVVNGGEVIEIEWGSKRYQRPAQPAPLAVPSSTVRTPEGQWRKANPDRDIKAALRFLKSLDQERFPEIRLDAAVRGRLFLFAFALQQRGDKSSANLLLNEVFRHVESRQKVVVDALNMVADAQYENLYRQFRADHDWKAYRNGIKDLLAKYTRGWNRAPALRLLLSRVDERLSHPNPVPTTTNALTGAEVTLAGKMMGLRAIRTPLDNYSPPPILWMVPSAWRDSAATDTELDVRGLGVKGIPFLLALVADGALTEADRTAVSGGGEWFAPVRPIDGLDEDQIALQVFATLNRPATRGEIAVRWLTDLVPEPFTGGQWDQRKGAELIEAFQTFYDQHGKDSDEELAMLCLPGRYGNLSAPAVDFLLKQAASRRLPALEAYLLKQGEEKEEDRGETHGVPHAKLDLLVRYAALRGQEVRPMVLEVAAHLRKAAAEFKKPRNYGFSNATEEKAFVEQNRQSLAKAATDLEAIPYGISIEQQLALVTGDGPVESQYNRVTLLARLETMPPAEATRLLLKQAAATDRPKTRAALAGVLRALVGKRAVTGLKPTEQADLWRTLIADDRPTGAENEAQVSDGFLMLNERLFAIPEGADDDNDSGWASSPGDAGQPATRLIADFGRRGRDWLRLRVEARLAGTPEAKLPRYPSTTPLEAKACARMKNTLSGADNRTAMIEAVGALSLYERAELPGLLRHEPELNARLATAANVVTKVTVDGPDQALQARWSAWQGKVLTRELVDELQSFCTTQAAAGRQTTCLLTRKNDLQGCEVSMRQGKTVTKEASAAVPVTGLTGLVCGHGLYGVAFWRTAGEPKKDEWGKVETSEPEAMRTFQQAIETFCGSSLAVCDEAFVAFETKGDNK